MPDNAINQTLEGLRRLNPTAYSRLGPPPLSFPQPAVPSTVTIDPNEIAARVFGREIRWDDPKSAREALFHICPVTQDATPTTGGSARSPRAAKPKPRYAPERCLTPTTAASGSLGLAGWQAPLTITAQTALTKLVELRGVLVPIDPCAPGCERYQEVIPSIIRTLQQVVVDLGKPGGAVQQFVDLHLGQLVGAKWNGPEFSLADPWSFGGLIGELRDALGFGHSRVTSLAHEQIATAFLTVGSFVGTLAAMWQGQRSSRRSADYLTIQIPHIYRELNGMIGAVRQLQMVVPPGILQTATLQNVDPPMVASDLLGAVLDFAQSSGPAILREGRTRLRSEFAARAEILADLVKELVVPRDEEEDDDTLEMKDGDVSPICAVAPRDLRRRRAQSAIVQLLCHLQRSATLARAVVHGGGFSIESITLFDRDDLEGPGIHVCAPGMTVFAHVRGTNLRELEDLALAHKGGPERIHARLVRDGDESVVMRFEIGNDAPHGDWLITVNGTPYGGRVVIDAKAV